MIKDKFLANSKRKFKDTKNESKYLLSKDKDDFFLIFDNCPYPIFLIDKKGGIKDINSSAIKLLKYDKHEIKGKFFTDLLENNSKKLVNNEFYILSKKRKTKKN